MSQFDQYAELIEAHMRKMDGPATLSESAVPPEVISKYRNRKTEIDGRVFDSKKEANRYLDLREQQRAGVITDLECQVSIPLIVNNHCVAEYVCDFRYFRGGEMVIEDVKSEVTKRIEVYRLKRKILEANGIEVIER